MFRPLPILLGWRFSRAVKQNQFLSFISASSAIGIALGILVIVTVLSAMNGFEQALRTKLLAVVPHAEITTVSDPMVNWRGFSEQLERDPQINQVTPFVRFDALVSYKNELKPVQVRGIDFALEREIAPLDEFIESAQALPLAERNSVILGASLAKQLNVKIGDRVSLLVPQLNDRLKLQAPKYQNLTITGLFRMGGQLDATTALIRIDDAGALSGLGTDGVQGLRLQVEDIFAAGTIAYQAAFELPIHAYVTDWTRQQGHVYQDIQLVRSIAYLVMILIIGVACFNIVSTLVMAVNDKRSSIAILKTMGMKRRQIMASFMAQGLVNGILGTVAGGILGTLSGTYLSDILGTFEALLGHSLLSSDVYFISSIPSLLNPDDVILVCTLALIISLIATLYPAWHAARIVPAKELNCG